jgi:hypothetical protein
MRDDVDARISLRHVPFAMRFTCDSLVAWVVNQQL